MILSLRLTAKAPENGWLEYWFPFGKAYFQGRTVSFRECTLQKLSWNPSFTPSSSPLFQRLRPSRLGSFCVHICRTSFQLHIRLSQGALETSAQEPGSPILGGSSQDSDTWLITMVIVSPLTGVLGPLPNGLNSL